MEQLVTIDKHVQEHLPVLEKLDNKTDFPKIWEIAKPVLGFVANAFFVPQKWRKILQKLILGIDAYVLG